MAEHGPTKDLVERAKGGDQGAFVELTRFFSDRLRSTIERLSEFQLGPRASPEDVLQETLLQAYRSLARFEWKDEQSFGHWLSGIAKHVLAHAAQEAQRRQRPAADAPAPSSRPSPSKVLRRNERFDRLQAALDRLSPEHRDVIRLCRMECLTSTEAAERMGRSPAAVRQLLVRALRELKSNFGETDSLHLPDRHLRFGEKSDGP